MLAQAQDIFFPTKEGTVLEYKVFDKKQQETGMIRYTITDIKQSGDDMDITYKIESMDAKEKPLIKEEITINKKGDILYVDMSKFLNKVALDKAGEKAGKINITGNDMEIPSNLKPGDVLPDTNIEMTLKMGFMNINMSANVTDRKVEAQEKVTTKAGTFDTYKITNTVTANAMGMKTSTKSAEWIAKRIGMIKTESYDNEGNINSYTELISIKE